MPRPRDGIGQVTHDEGEPGQIWRGAIGEFGSC